MLKIIASNITKQKVLLARLNQINLTSYFQFNNVQIDVKSTIDKNEISQFKTLGENWWDLEGSVKPLHAMNFLRVPFVKDGLVHTGQISREAENSPKPLTDKLILDVGCGAGILSEPLARLGANVTGLDACTELIEIAKEHASRDSEIANNINYVSQDIEVFSEDNLEKYDAVVTSEVLEHVNQPDVFLKHCVRVLKPGGSLYVTTLNKTVLSWFLIVVFSENIANCVPKGTHDWDKFISPNEVQKILEHNDCRTRVIHGLTYNIMANTWHWIPFKDVNYALHAIKKI